jgi:MFS superfamily sulfate permease-like transporter
MAIVLFFLTGPLYYLPKAALGAILIFAAIGLFDVKSLRRLWRVSRAEFATAMVTTLGVIALDVLEGILLAVAMAMLMLVRRSARPPDAVLVRVPGMKGFHDLVHYPDAPETPGLLLYRFGAAIVFYNSAYLKKRVLELAAARPDLKAVIVDGSTVNTIDRTGAETLEGLAREFQRRGILFGVAGFRTEARAMLQRAGAMDAIQNECVYPTLKSALHAYLAAQPGGSADELVDDHKESAIPETEIKAQPDEDQP